jgi:DNA-binding helix-turn-helix protein
MGNGYTKENQNVYFRARKQAAMYNEKLSSREGASEMLGISPSALADYELGITKFVPVDKVVLMADLYNCPELRTGYCKHECPIGKSIPLATSVHSIEGIALRIIKGFNSDEIKVIEKDLIDIASDGVISEDEKPILKKIIKRLDELMVVISELKLAGEKALKER